MSAKGDKYYPLPTGSLQGENVGDLPDKGVSRGNTGKDMHLDGMSLDTEATNRQGGFRAGSDPKEACHSTTPIKGRA